MKLKKILASILALTMMFSMMSFSVSAENTVSVWDGTIDRTWYDANPTADSYTITTAAQFAGIADICNTVASNTGVHPFKGQTIYLGVDINLNGNNFSPIGDASGDHRYFYGSFDGQGHTISNIKIESDSAKYVGLFGKTGNPSYNQTFEDVTLENVTVLADGAQFVGGLIGRADKSIVTNVNVIGEIRISGDRFVGGVLGHSYAQITDCSVEASGTIKANTWQAGGLVGAHYAADGASVSNCSVNGGASDLTVTSYYAAAGGVIGTVTLVDGVEPVIDGITVENVTVEADSADYGSGLALVASGYNATNATVSNVTTTVANEECVPADAEAKIGDVYYTSFYEAAKNATADTTIEVLADSTVDEWQYMDAENISIDGKNHSVTINAITKNTSDNQGSLIRAMNGELNIKDITFNLCAGSVVAQVTAGTMENVTVNGGKYGYLVDGATTIKNCVFNGQSGAAIYFRDVDGAPGSVVDGCTFNLTNSRAACLWTNEVFTNNIINGADNLYHGLTILADSTATVSGNKFDSKSPIEVYVMDDAQGAFKLTKCD